MKQAKKLPTNKKVYRLHVTSFILQFIQKIKKKKLYHKSDPFRVITWRAYAGSA